MPFTNFPQGFAAGLSVRGMPLTQMQPGQVFFVGNSTVLNPNQRAGSDGNRGTFLDPFATLDFAVNTACTASRGDIVFVLPGHAETLANATTLTLATAGVAVIGLGAGNLRPTFTFTAAAANIPLSAANVSIQNCLFIANFADVASAFTVTGTALASDFAMDACEFRDTSAILNLLTVLTGNNTAQNLARLNFTRNRIHSLGTTAATTAIKVASAAQTGWRLVGNTGTWAVLNDTPTLADIGSGAFLNLTIADNRVVRPSTSTTGSLFMSTSTACTGYVYDNYSWHLDNSGGLLAPTGTKLGFQNNYCMITGAADKSGLINPAAV
jgi:hypothetical protein